MNKILDVIDKFFFYDEDDETDTKFNHFDVILIVILICIFTILGIQQLYSHKIKELEKGIVQNDRSYESYSDTTTIPNDNTYQYL